MTGLSENQISGVHLCPGHCKMLTSATNMLVLEGTETQDVISALERHGCRYGFPAEVFVDSSSQLAALDASKAMLRDANTFLYD